MRCVRVLYQRKNVWRIGGEKCPAEYNTCTTFRGETGQVSYLSRTLDFGQCNANSVGCQAYSLEELAAPTAAGDTWLASVDVNLARKRAGTGQNQVVYFNGAIDSLRCNQSGEGCSAFSQAQIDGATGLYVNPEGAGDFIRDDAARLLYLKKAPDYLGCYDAKPLTPEVVDWPETRAELNDIDANARCSAFAQVCVPDEVGCESYRRTNVAQSENLDIPAIVGDNRCDESCVG